MGASTTQTRIVRAKTTDGAVDAASIIAAAFAGLKVCEWLVPDAGHRIGVLTDVFTITALHALEHGSVHLALGAGDDRADVTVGAAVWFDRTRHLPEPVRYESGLRAAAGENYERFRLLDQLLDLHHPRGPHHHLAFLAVLADHQDQGLGSALLSEYLPALDDRRLPTYLEASNADSARLYRRIGYQQRTDPFAVGNAQFIPMWRDPAHSPTREVDPTPVTQDETEHPCGVLDAKPAVRSLLGRANDGRAT